MLFLKTIDKITPKNLKKLSKYLENHEKEGYFGFWNAGIFEKEKKIVKTGNFWQKKFLNWAKGDDLLPNFIPSTTLSFWKNENLIGLSNIRHELPPHLLKFGGNIGYNVGKMHENQGFGTKILKLTLKFSKIHKNSST